jgi:hypothetical protein
LRRVGKRNLKARLAHDREPRHRHPVLEVRGGTLRLERLHAYRGKQYRVQREGRTGGARHGQMAQVRRVETAAKEGYARFTAAR